MQISDLSGFDPDWLVTATTRYSLPRKTAAASCFADELAANWDKLPASVRGVIRVDVDAAFEAADKSPYYWDPCDRASWEKVRSKWK